jgi:four helix bundle protein
MMALGAPAGTWGTTHEEPSMPARAARAPRAPATTSPAAAIAAVAEPTTPAFAPDTPPDPQGATTAAPPAEGQPAPQPSGYKGLKVWQRAMDLAVGVHALAAALPAREHDGLSADLRRVASQVPSYVAAGNSLFHRVEYVQYLSAAHGALARLETLLLVAERLGLVEPKDSAPLLSQASQVGYLLRALTRALQPPTPDGGVASPRPSPRRPAPTATAD